MLGIVAAAAVTTFGLHFPQAPPVPTTMSVGPSMIDSMLFGGRFQAKKQDAALPQRGAYEARFTDFCATHSVEQIEVLLRDPVENARARAALAYLKATAYLDPADKGPPPIAVPALKPLVEYAPVDGTIMSGSAD